MIAYIDSSVLVRLALGQSNTLPEWRKVERGLASAIARVEVLRSLDRLRLRASLADLEVARYRSASLQLLSSLELVQVSQAVLDRAAQPLPTELRTLDAIHLATALLVRERAEPEIVVATHDVALGIAAQAQGFRVFGI